MHKKFAKDGLVAISVSVDPLKDDDGKSVEAPLFCSGQSLLPTGEVFAAGGTLAYPVYDPGYQEAVETIRKAVSQFKNLQPVGRNGMHKYNNQDHSMMTAVLAAKNLEGGNYDLWNVNSDAEYHEEGSAGEDKTGRLVPQRVAS